MKPLKILGLAAVAAAALIALVGAGTASATVLCKNNASTSACSETYGSGQSIEASLSETTTLETTSATVLDTCTGGTLKAKTTNAGGASETVKANVETLSWSGCSKTTDTLKNGSLEIHWISGTDNGTLTASSSEWTINTIFGTCTYGFGTSTDLGTVTGGNPAKVSVNAILTKTAGSGLCPADARWKANYTFTAPQPLYVATTEGEVAEVEVEAAEKQTVGTTKMIKIKNERDSAVTIGMDVVTDATILEMTGASCAGNLAATATCEKRGLKCLAPGEAAWGAELNPGQVLLSIRVECVEP
jgi:hypothetical protein